MKKSELELEPIEAASYSVTRDSILNAGHIGIEKRINTRRQTADRREMIRFGPNEKDRRSGEDRRKSTQKWQFRL